MNSYKSFLLPLMVVAVGFFLSCKDDISSSDKILIANTNKTKYNSDESIIVNITNFSENSVFVQQCGEKLYSFYDKLDSTFSGGPTFTTVCRNLKNYELKSGHSTVDTILMLPGRYRLKYKYDFENIMPELNKEDLFTNQFIVQ